jgi:acetate kinase
MREHGLTLADVGDALEHRSGLAGLSGGSGDVREIEAAAMRGDERGRMALEIYAHRIAAAVASMCVSIGGLDALVFTGGVGEHSARVRAGIASRLSFLGVEIDAAANEAGRADVEIATPQSYARIHVVTAHEEIVVAREVRRLMG